MQLVNSEEAMSDQMLAPECSCIRCRIEKYLKCHADQRAVFPVPEAAQRARWAKFKAKKGR